VRVGTGNFLLQQLTSILQREITRGDL
jgi:hypothetical protein